MSGIVLAYQSEAYSVQIVQQWNIAQSRNRYPFSSSHDGKMLQSEVSRCMEWKYGTFSLRIMWNLFVHWARNAILKKDTKKKRNREISDGEVPNNICIEIHLAHMCKKFRVKYCEHLSKTKAVCWRKKGRKREKEPKNLKSKLKRTWRFPFHSLS